MCVVQDYYNGPSCPTGSGRIRAGQACVSKYSEDGMWYRARVTHAKGGLLGIHYVDYGNCEEVPESSLRPVSLTWAPLHFVQILSLCFFFACYMSSVQPRATD